MNRVCPTIKPKGSRKIKAPHKAISHTLISASPPTPTCDRDDQERPARYKAIRLLPMSRSSSSSVLAFFAIAAMWSAILPNGGRWCGSCRIGGSNVRRQRTRAGARPRCNQRKGQQWRPPTAYNARHAGTFESAPGTRPCSRGPASPGGFPEWKGKIGPNE